MRILLTGGTGLIGRALCHHWQRQGHTLWVWSRNPGEVAQRCGPGVKGIARLQELDGQGLDALVNLAGAPIAERPWTRGRRQVLWNSRVRLTEQLLEWLESQPYKPQCLLSGSAVGWYGDAGERELREDSPAQGSDFASQLCEAWEAAAQAAEAMGVRVVLLRTGLVLAADGGMLDRLLPVFRLGLGGWQGSGRQWMPWIHLADQVALIDHLLHNSEARGPYNLCAPNPLRNIEFSKALGQQLQRPVWLKAPASLLRLGLGEMAGLLLGGQRALPARAQDEGFAFRFTHLQPALADLLKPS